MGWGGAGWDVNVHWHFHTYVMLRHCPFFCNFHTYVMLRLCPFFCNFHTYVMLRWVGWCGWDVNVHWHFHTYVMLRHCPFFCNFHTYVMLRLCPFFCNFHTYVMLRWGGVGWDVNVHWHFHTYVMLRHCQFFCNFHTGGNCVRIRSQTISPPQKAPWKWIAKYFDMSDRSNGAGKTHASCWRQLRRTSSNCLDSTSGLLKKKNAERFVDGKVKPSSSETPIFASQLTFRYGETMNLC